jgi:hypothetical protein
MPENPETNLEAAERIGRTLSDLKLSFVVIGAVSAFALEVRFESSPFPNSWL